MQPQKHTQLHHGVRRHAWYDDGCGTTEHTLCRKNNSPTANAKSNVTQLLLCWLAKCREGCTAGVDKQQRTVRQGGPVNIYKHRQVLFAKKKKKCQPENDVTTGTNPLLFFLSPSIPPATVAAGTEKRSVTAAKPSSHAAEKGLSGMAPGRERNKEKRERNAARLDIFQALF